MVDTIKLNTRVRILQYLGKVYSDFYFSSFSLKNKEGQNPSFFDLESYSGTGNIFDLASISKALSVSLLVLDKMYQGKLDPHTSLGEYIKDTKLSENLDYRYKSISIYDILSHQSGIPAWRNFYTRCQGEENIKFDKKYLLKRLNFIAQNDELTTPGTMNYSDVGFILLGLVLEEKEKLSLDKQFLALLSKLSFTPPKDGFIGYGFELEDKKRFIPTVNFCPLRQKKIQGQVHDENCYFLGEKTGHAGLFADGLSLKEFLKTLFASKFGEFIRSCVIKDSLRSSSLYSFGFRRGIIKGTDSYYLSKDSFGHTGFSGGCFWISEDRGIIFLTNRTIYQRVYPMQELRAKVLKDFIVK